MPRYSIHGPTGLAKTWLALLAVAQCLKRGERALYLDYESFPVQIVKRLSAAWCFRRRVRRAAAVLPPGVRPRRPRYRP